MFAERDHPYAFGAAAERAIANLQERGEIFIDPAAQVYEGMIIGENARNSDMDVKMHQPLLSVA